MSAVWVHTNPKTHTHKDTHTLRKRKIQRETETETEKERQTGREGESREKPRHLENLTLVCHSDSSSLMILLVLLKHKILMIWRSYPFPCLSTGEPDSMVF